MKKQKLGTTGIEVMPLAFGGNVFGWTVDESKSCMLLDSFVEGGFNFIDTADMYSTWVPGNKGGESESILGKWIKARGNRASMIIATKVGLEMGPDKKGLSKHYILKAVEQSLRRLQTDYIDLYQSHRPDTSIPIEETLEAYATLIKEGKVRAIGASNYTKAQMEESLSVSVEKDLRSYQTLQPQYNLYDRADFETNLEKFCEKNHIGVIPYYSLASGFLTGKYRSEADVQKSTRGGGVVSHYLNERGLRILKALDEVSAQLNTTPAKVSLAWLRTRPSIVAPIASATSLTQLEDIMGAARLNLNTAAIEVLNSASKY